tara:strand:- start:5220 stop:5696 length:477 start_codon:yes stop_codon:yes gene_type:complete
MIKTTVTGAGNAKDAIEKALKEFMTDKYVTVGIHEDAGQHEDDGITNAQLGATMEFGTDNGNIPARPWLRPGVESGNEEYLNIITDSIESGEPLEKALEIVGVVAVAKAQQYMIDLKSPANAPQTIARKGSSNPLIDTGSLKSSVTHKVTSEKPTEGI